MLLISSGTVYCILGLSVEVVAIFHLCKIKDDCILSNYQKKNNNVELSMMIIT